MTSAGWEPDALTAHVRICEGANSIVHGSNIVTPPKETGGQQGTQTVSYTQESSLYSPGAAIHAESEVNVNPRRPVTPALRSLARCKVMHI